MVLPSSPVPSVAHAFAVLRLFAAGGEALTLSEVARARGLSPSTTLNLLRALVAEGALLRGPDKRYRLAADWAASGVLTDPAERTIARLRPAMARFAARFEAAVGLWQQAGPDRLELVALSESGAATRIHLVIGQRQPIGSGATGRALAADERVDGVELARRHAAVRWQRPFGLDDYLASVRLAARTGYAVDDGLGHAGVCSLGAALPAGTDPARRFCVSASVFAGSRTVEQIGELGTALVTLAREAGPTPR